MTLKFDVWPRKIIGHLFYTTSSFVYHFKSIGEFKLKLHSGNAQFGSQSAIFLSLVTLKFDGWPWKTIGHLFYTTSSFVLHFKSIGELKLKLQSRNAQFGSKSALFCPVWPWNLTDALEKLKGISSMLLQALCIISQSSVNTNWSYSPQTPNLGQIWLFLESCDLEIWRMTLQNNRAPLLCYFKLCASLHTHWWIQIGVTVRKRSIRVKIDDF